MDDENEMAKLDESGMSRTLTKFSSFQVRREETKSFLLPSFRLLSKFRSQISQSFFCSFSMFSMSSCPYCSKIK